MSLKNTICDVNDLEAGKEYDFRVKTSNALGESGPIQLSKTFIAKDKFSKLWQFQSKETGCVQQYAFVSDE